MDPVKRQSIHLKALFFLCYVGFGCLSPYAAIFYKHVLIDADRKPAIGLIGLIFFVMPLVSLIANIPAGILADKFRSGKRLITFFCFGTALFAMLIGLAGEAGVAGQWGLGGKFFFIFLLLFFMNCCYYPITPMIDTETLHFLNAHSRREFYGAYRLWGTYGWSVATILMGALLYRFGHDPLIFYASAAAYAVMGFASWSGIEAKPTTQPIIIPWHHLKKDALFQGFLAFVFLSGVVLNASYIYIGYFFDDIMKTPLEIGWILGTWTLFEIPVLFFSRPLIDRLGNRWLIVSGLLLSGLRLILFSFFTRETPYLWKWTAALLQGPGFALMHLGIIDFVDRRAHPDMRATYITILNVARVSLASALGGIMGSWLIREWGSAFLMQFCGLFTLVLIFLFLWLLRKYEAKQ
ncbi:MAG: MFS transporter [Deltaproteobacteria bacterium]|nr:MFS transporter [Deltaproteobacteria bacterium]